MTKLLVLYVFHIFNDRVKHFIKNCIFDEKNVDFIIISNDKNNIFKVPDYVKTLLMVILDLLPLLVGTTNQ